MFAGIVLSVEGCWRHIRGCGVFDQDFNVRRRGNASGSGGRRGTGPISDLPIEDLGARPLAIGANDQDALRGEGAVHDLFLVGIAKNFRDLAYEIELNSDIELVPTLSEVVV